MLLFHLVSIYFYLWRTALAAAKLLSDGILHFLFSEVAHTHSCFWTFCFDEWYFFVSCRPDWQVEALCSRPVHLFVHSFVCYQTCVRCLQFFYCVLLAMCSASCIRVYIKSTVTSRSLSASYCIIVLLVEYACVERLLCQIMSKFKFYLYVTFLYDAFCTCVRFHNNNYLRSLLTQNTV